MTRTVFATLIILVLVLVFDSTAHAFEVSPDRDWSFTIGNLRFGYVEWPSRVPAGNYTNAQPVEFHVGLWHVRFETAAAFAAWLAVSAFAMLAVFLVLDAPYGDSSGTKHPTEG